MKALLTASLFLIFAASSRAQNLTIDFIDVEGGQATLFVTPSRQSLLIDTGWPGFNGRDADRIVAMAHKAGLAKIDYLLITHYHVDHVGGVPQLAARIPIGTFIDHGVNRELSGAGSENTISGFGEYQKLLASGKYQHIVATPGMRLPISGIDATVISADGQVIQKPLPGAAGEENAFCNVSEVRPADTTENARSLGIEISFGKLRILDLGDLTWDKEMQLMCPANRLGHIDILVVSHHGFNQSSSPALVAAITPRVAIMDDGANKGGSTPTFKTLAGIPGLKALWELHYSNEAGSLNVAPEFIANPQGPDAAHHLELTARPDGSFSVMNSRTGNIVEYAAKP